MNDLHDFGRRGLLAILAVGLLCQQACVQPTSSELSSSSQPIVGGAIESGWDAVGALRVGLTPFCTATLIAPSWVLTSAACAGPELGYTPDQVSFFIGTDAKGPAGTDYQAASFHPHTGFSMQSPDKDNIALVRLAAPVPASVTPVPLNSTDISALIGDDLLYVGFGTYSGYYADDDGVKRSALIPIGSTQVKTYTADTLAQSICTGDTGGPGLYEITGQWKLIGVNILVTGSGPDPCKGGTSTHTRVDAYRAWIDSVVGAVEDAGVPDAAVESGAADAAIEAESDSAPDTQTDAQADEDVEAADAFVPEDAPPLDAPEPDAGTPDAVVDAVAQDSPGQPDAEAPADSSAGEGDATGSNDASDSAATGEGDDGCGCRVAGESEGGRLHWGVLAVAGIAFAIRRRRIRLPEHIV